MYKGKKKILGHRSVPVRNFFEKERLYKEDVIKA